MKSTEAVVVGTDLQPGAGWESGVEGTAEAGPWAQVPMAVPSLTPFGLGCC